MQDPEIAITNSFVITVISKTSTSYANFLEVFGQVRQDFEQPDVVKDVLGHGMMVNWTMWSLKVPSNLNYSNIL